MDDVPRPEHLQTYFTAASPPGGWPRRFGIVTAYNPDCRNRSEAANEEADAELLACLAATGLPHFRTTNSARDGSHAEPGYGITAASPEDIRPISRRLGQTAFYWVEDGLVSVMNTEGHVLHPVGNWLERLR